MLSILLDNLPWRVWFDSWNHFSKWWVHFSKFSLHCEGLLGTSLQVFLLTLSKSELSDLATWNWKDFTKVLQAPRSHFWLFAPCLWKLQFSSGGQFESGHLTFFLKRDSVNVWNIMLWEFFCVFKIVQVNSSFGLTASLSKIFILSHSLC